MTTALFLARHLLALVLLLTAALGAGTLVLGRRGALALRLALGLALWGHALFALAYLHQLRIWPIAALFVVSLPLSALRERRALLPEASSTTATPLLTGAAVFALAVLLFLLALQPPLAFDETLYHLPFVRELARSGMLQFLWDLRLPVFPQFHELLCVPLFLLAGDTATHLVALVETAITAALLFDWGRREAPGAGLLAAAFFLGSPLVVSLATVTYVDAALTLFVTAGFYCLDRSRFEGSRWLALSGFFLGTACSVKYLGGYFAVAALLLVALRSHTRRTALPAFALACLAAALPTTIWLVTQTHNPVFPFLPQVFGATKWTIAEPPVPFPAHVMRILRVAWDVTFARERLDHQPPVTPLLIPAVVVLLAAALRDVRARYAALVCVAYVVVFSYLPQDSRYLVPLLPLIGITAAAAFCLKLDPVPGSERSADGASQLPPDPSLPASRPPSLRMNVLALAPGLLYAVYLLARHGLPPATPAAREAVLERRIPEYAALRLAHGGPTYVCGAEQLNYYGGGALIGDVIGPYSNARILGDAADTATIALKVQDLNTTWFLVAKRVCKPPRPDGGMTLVYEDAAAQLWRLDRPAVDRDADGQRWKRPPS